MKCPQCGYVTSLELSRCKKCGQKLSDTPDDIPPLFGKLDDIAFSDSPAAPAGQQAEAANGRSDIKIEPEKGRRPSREEFLRSEPAAGRDPASPEEGATWQEELSKRLGEFRERHGPLSKDGEPRFESSLGLDFDSKPAFRRKLIEFPSSEPSDAESGSPLEEAAEPSQIDWDEALQDNGTRTKSGQPDLDFDFESAARKGARSGSILFVEEERTAPVTAPISRRFAAGVIDLLVLLAGAAIFALIYHQAGGRPSKSPLDLAVFTFIAAFMVLVYFSASVAYSSATPGLALCGLEVRSFDGHVPSAKDSFWRGFGYLISMAALMLGFIWALVDGDGLTWHDRMSRTAAVEAESTVASDR